MLIRRHKQRGFTLVELMVGLVIVGLLLTQALPSFMSWIQNMQIRNSAEAILNGLQLARAQAVRSNDNTELVLIATGTEPVAGNIGAAPTANGTNWIVRRFQAAGVYNANCLPAEPNCDFVQGRSGQEGSRNAIVTAGPGSGLTLGGPFISGSYVFTSLGRLLNPPFADVIIDISSSSDFTNKRPMRIIISTGGQVLMCDPNKVDPTNPQFCP